MFVLVKNVGCFVFYCIKVRDKLRILSLTQIYKELHSVQAICSYSRRDISVVRYNKFRFSNLLDCFY